MHNKIEVITYKELSCLSILGKVSVKVYLIFTNAEREPSRSSHREVMIRLAWPGLHSKQAGQGEEGKRSNINASSL